MVLRPCEWFSCKQLYILQTPTICKVSHTQPFQRWGVFFIDKHLPIFLQNNYGGCMFTEEGCFYHAFNRGCNKGLIFSEKSDYVTLIQIIKESKHQDFVNIIAFALMPNHYHFLVQQRGTQRIYKWFQYVFNTYTQYYNKKYCRKGTLFESTVKFKELRNDSYLETTINYIHTNPQNKFQRQFCSLNYFKSEIVYTKFYYDSFDSLSAYLDILNYYKSGKEAEELEY